MISTAAIPRHIMDDILLTPLSSCTDRCIHYSSMSLLVSITQKRVRNRFVVDLLVSDENNTTERNMTLWKDQACSLESGMVLILHGFQVNGCELVVTEETLITTVYHPRQINMESSVDIRSIDALETFPVLKHHRDQLLKELRASEYSLLLQR
jgi:hypothetical protein